ncbi:hypothetical protein F7734_51970 [Scytonema sp. UIC 10036]|uniref:hypothetical protein n=1 Tax=Scytonema sp. UIC 10036 TaxID=2304196 RepID=UPI0012DA6293|nr:hypothetical protein [Scytonema sp. UIC 10036]MUH00344.1 hypothetical protein [Scytonema sp. UIC 10036]
MQGFIYLIRAIGTDRYKIESARSESAIASRIEDYNKLNSLYPIELIHSVPVLETSCCISIQIAISDFRDKTGWFELPDDVAELVLDEMDNYSPKLAPMDKTAEAVAGAIVSPINLVMRGYEYLVFNANPQHLFAVICFVVALILLARPFTDFSQSTDSQREPIREELMN